MSMVVEIECFHVQINCIYNACHVFLKVKGQPTSEMKWTLGNVIGQDNQTSI